MDKEVNFAGYESIVEQQPCAAEATRCNSLPDRPHPQHRLQRLSSTAAHVTLCHSRHLSVHVRTRSLVSTVFELASHHYVNTWDLCANDIYLSIYGYYTAEAGGWGTVEYSFLYFAPWLILSCGVDANMDEGWTVLMDEVTCKQRHSNVRSVPMMTLSKNRHRDDLRRISEIRGFERRLSRRGIGSTLRLTATCSMLHITPTAIVLLLAYYFQNYYQ